MVDIVEDLDMDEKTQEAITDIQKKIESISTNMGFMKDTIKEIKDCYVTKIEFMPVKAVVYAVVGFVGLAFLGALVALVIVKS